MRLHSILQNGRFEDFIQKVMENEQVKQTGVDFFDIPAVKHANSVLCDASISACEAQSFVQSLIYPQLSGCSVEEVVGFYTEKMLLLDLIQAIDTGKVWHEIYQPGGIGYTPRRTLLNSYQSYQAEENRVKNSMS